MSAVKEYAFTMFLLSAFVAVVIPLISYKENGALKFATGLLVLYAAVTPLASVVGSFDINSVIPKIDTDGAEYESTAEAALAEGIAKAVAQEFSISYENITVELSGFDFEAMRAGKITVILRGGGLFKNYEKIEKYVTALGCGECEVRVEA